MTGVFQGMLVGPRASPGKPRELAALAGLLLQLGESEAAVEAAETALRLIRDPDAPHLPYILDVQGSALLDCYRRHGGCTTAGSGRASVPTGHRL